MCKRMDWQQQNSLLKQPLRPSGRSSSMLIFSFIDPETSLKSLYAADFKAAFLL